MKQLLRFSRDGARLCGLVLFAIAGCFWTGQVSPAAADETLSLEIETPAPATTAIVHQGDQTELTLNLSSVTDQPVGPVVIAIESRGGTVEIVKNRSIRWRGKGGDWTGQLRQLAPGTTLPFKIKLNYAPSILSSTDKVVGGKLTVTASVSGADITASAQVERVWKVGNCAGAYRAALTTIGTRHNDPLQASIKSVRTGWRSLPGRWLFAPARVKYTKRLRSMIRKATPLIRYRGVDPKLRQAVQAQEVARAVFDLDKYVNQPGSPSLCTGASRYMGFFEQRLEGFRGQHDAAEQAFELAAQTADWQLLDAESVFAAPFEVPEDADAEKLIGQRRQLADVLRMARAAWSDIVDAGATQGVLPDHFAYLSDVRSRLGEIALDRRSPLQGDRRALQTALTAVEAMTYVRGAYAKYDQIASHFAGLIASVRSAHSENCVCSAQQQ